MSRLLSFLFSILFSLWLFDAYAQVPQVHDSAAALREVVVRAPLPQREVVAPQRLEGARLHALKGTSVADALRYFSGFRSKTMAALADSRLSTSAVWVAVTSACFTMACP